jgi:Vacuolar sorting-associated protein 13, N-terminal
VQLRKPHQSFRPATRPSQQAAQLWWRYAVRAVTNQSRQGRPSWWDLAKYLKIQREYVPLYVKLLQESVAAAQADEKILSFDKDVPYQVALHFRKMAHAQVRRRNNRAAQRTAQQPKQRTWVGWALGAKPAGKPAEPGALESANAEADAEGQAGEGEGGEGDKERSYLTDSEVQALEDIVQEQVGHYVWLLSQEIAAVWYVV